MGLVGGTVTTHKPATIPVSEDGQSVPVSGTLTATIDESTLATSAKQDTGNTSLASLDGKVGAAAAAGDTDANPTVGGIRAFLEVFGGTTWQRLKAGVTAVSATLTGMMNVLPWAQYNASPTVRTTGQGGPLEADANGALKISPAVAVDDVAGVVKVEQRYSYTNITTQTTTTIKSGAGFLHAISVNTQGVSTTITIYDNTAGSGTKIGVITLGSAITGADPFTIIFDVAFSTGLTIVTAVANADITVSSR